MTRNLLSLSDIEAGDGLEQGESGYGRNGRSDVHRLPYLCSEIKLCQV